jgi:trehalose 6-phosphate synthase
MAKAGTSTVSAIEASIVVASNRGPVSFDRDDRGRLSPRRGTGGLVTALSGVFYRDDTTWLSAAMTEGDSAVAR